jgi:tripartite-type tricarboxylate transporter receptor subunit TctC
VPTLAELGLKDLDVEIWVAVAVSVTMAERNREKLETLILDILKTPEVKKQLVTQGWDVAAVPAALFTERLAHETSMLADIIEKQNIRAN